MFAAVQLNFLIPSEILISAQEICSVLPAAVYRAQCVWINLFRFGFIHLLLLLSQQSKLERIRTHTHTHTAKCTKTDSVRPHEHESAYAYRLTIEVWGLGQPICIKRMEVECGTMCVFVMPKCAAIVVGHRNPGRPTTPSWHEFIK